MILFSKYARRRLPYFAAILSVCGLAAYADASDTVTIKFDAGDGITGELLEATNNSVRLDTIMGVITIPFDGVSCIGASCPEEIRLKVEEKPVVITSLDGTVVLSGNLLDIEQGQYVLATDLGEMRVSLDKATCEGAACPEQSTQPAFGGEVVLVNGTSTIKGKLTGLDLEAQAYIVESELYGLIHVSMDAFSCSGEGCPSS